MPNFNVPAWAKNKLIPTELDRVDLCPEGCNSAAFIKLIKSKKEDSEMNWEEIKKTLKAEHVAVIEAEIEKAKTEAKTEAETAAKAEAKAEMDKKDKEIEDLKKKACNTGAESEEEAVKKALEECNPVIRAMFEKMQAREKAAEAAAKVAKEKAENDAAIAKAKEFADIPVEEKEMVDVCKAINTMGEHSEKIYNILKAAANMAADEVDGDNGSISITKSVGSSNSKEPNAWNNFDLAVKNVMKERNVSEAEATMAIMKEKPQLYYDYLDSEQNK